MPQDAGFPDPTPNSHKPRPEGEPVIGRVDPIAFYDEPAAPAGLTKGPDLGALLRSLRHRWMAAAAFGLPLAALAAAAAWFLLTPKYTAFAQFRVLAVQPVVLGGNKDVRYDFPTYIRTLASQIKSRPVIMQALKSDEVKRIGLEARVPDPAQYLDEELKPEFNDQTEFLTISYPASDPAEAVAVVKAISNSFLDLIVYAENHRREASLSDLEKVYGETGDRLRKRRADLKKLADQLGTTDKETLSQQQMQLLDSLRDARNALNQANSELFKTKALLDAHNTRIEAVKHAPPPSGPDLETALDTDTEYKQLYDRLKRVQDVIDGFGEGSRQPTYIAARDVARGLKKKIETRKSELAEKLKRRTDKRDMSELELVKVQLENQIALLTTERDRLEKDVNELKAKVAQIGTSTTDLETLRADVRREEQLVNDLGNQVDRLRVEVKSPARVSLFQEADLQKKDAKKQILAAVAAPVGVLFAVCMGLAWSEYKQRRVRCAGDVADGLGIRVVGAVPALRHAERHLVGANGEPDVAAYPVLESFDAIRTQLLHDARTGTTRVVQVTSAAAGEGKTTLACHLATSLARAGRKTLLIDGDLRRPAIHQLFELPLQPGFSEVLLGEVEVAEGVQQTTLAGLSVMPAGQWDREVLQSLARDGLEGIFEKLQEEFDFIIIDSHPVLPAADALLLARQADAVILSVLREVSQTPRVYAASRRLESVGARVLGAVVNAAAADEAYANPALAQAAA
jgi:capsular exopolysaccharide synthesis family protein